MKDFFCEPMFVRPRWPLASFVSLGLHVGVAIALAVIGSRPMFSSRGGSQNERLTFLMFATPHASPPGPAATPATQIEPKTLAALDTRPSPLPVPEPERTAPPPPPPPPPAPATPPAVTKPEPPQAPGPQVVVGAFSGPSAGSAVETRREVRVAGFDAPTAISPDLKLKSATVGAFDGQPGGAARPGTDRAGVVAAGFDGTGGQSRAGQRPVGVVTHAGFGGNSLTPPGNRPATPAAPIQPSGFEDVRATSKTADTSPAVDRSASQVEVMFKPTPAYTDEAKSLKIEGEVLLDVAFNADDTIRVVRVIRGLGHGLDEMAIKAAERIRFKPATAGGRPIDFQARVTIVFRLT